MQPQLLGFIHLCRNQWLTSLRLCPCFIDFKYLCIGYSYVTKSHPPPIYSVNTVISSFHSWRYLRLHIWTERSATGEGSFTSLPLSLSSFGMIAPSGCILCIIFSVIKSPFSHLLVPFLLVAFRVIVFTAMPPVISCYFYCPLISLFLEKPHLT